LRLDSLTTSTGNETYTYSAFGTRAEVGTRTFLRAGVTAGVLDDGNAEYTPGVSEVRSGTTTYSHSGLKNMGAQTDAGANPAVQATRTYDAFGGVQASTGSWQGPFSTAGAFGYQSPQTGNEQGGLHLLGHRYYDASSGRFLTRDPIGDGSNWYAYCENDPNGSADPSGPVKITAYWYKVEGTDAYHLGLLIEDNVHGKGKRAYAGGPEVYFGPGGTWNPWGQGKLVDKSGPWGPGHQDWRGGADGKRGWSGSVVLVEDDSPYEPWVDWADEIVDGMDGTVGYFGLGNNSNGFFERLITELWLDGRFDKAMEKRRRAGHPRPWTPGTNPWETARAPMPRFRPRDKVR